MNYPVQHWSRKPAGSDIVPGLVAFAAEIECGHAYEQHGPEGMAMPSLVECSVCKNYAEMAAELDAAGAESAALVQ